MRRGARHLWSALLVGAFLAGCGDDAADTTANGGATTGATAEAQRISTPSEPIATPPASGALDEVVWNIPQGEPLSVDPAFDTSTTVSPNLCDTLQRRDVNDKLVPGLAESTEYPDDRTIVFNLRENATFWDDSPVTAEDVVWSLKRSKGDVPSPNVPPFFAHFWVNVESITATGPKQVTVRFSQPDALFRGLTASGPIAAIQQKAFYQRAGKEYGTSAAGVMCSGPFKLDKWTPGREIVLVPNPSYWDAELAPKVKRLVFRFITDNAAIAAGLLSGELDGSSYLPATASEALRDATSGTLLPALGAEFSSVVAIGGPMADPGVRRALNLSIDRDAIAKSVYHGQAEPTASFYPRWTWSFEPDAFAAAADALPGAGERDVAAAKAAFEAAGAPSAPIRLGIDGSDQTQVRVASIMQAGAREAGMNVEIKSLSTTQYQSLYSDEQARAGLDAAILNNSNFSPDPGEELGYFFTKDGIANFVGYDNAFANEMVPGNVRELDPVKRARLLTDLQDQVIGQDQAVIPFVVRNYVSFVENGIGGFTASYSNRSRPWAAMLGATAE